MQNYYICPTIAPHSPTFFTRPHSAISKKNTKFATTKQSSLAPPPGRPGSTNKKNINNGQNTTCAENTIARRPYPRGERRPAQAPARNAQVWPRVGGQARSRRGAPARRAARAHRGREQANLPPPI